MSTILLIERHPLLRLGLRQLLAQADLAHRVIDIDPATLPWADHASLRNADLMIYGWRDNASGEWGEIDEACRWLAPQRVLVLAEGLPSANVQETMPPIVAGLLSKSCCAHVLDAAIRLVLAGGECFPAMVHAEPTAHGGLRAVPNVSQPHGADKNPAQWDDPLEAVAGAGMRGDITIKSPPLIQPDIETPSFGSHLLNITERQYEVLALLARGYPIKTVSRVLNISVATAKTHACTLYHRMQVRNKGEAVYEALRRGAKLNWPGPSSLGTVQPHANGIALSSVCQAA